jgi:hypothetical protein
LDPPPYIGKEDRLTLTFEKKKIFKLKFYLWQKAVNK